MAEKKSSLLIILYSLVRHRRLIVINVFAVTLATLIICLLLPNWYRATTVILPPEKSESLSEIAISMGLQSLALGGAGFALPVMASPSDLLASIAESRTVAEGVVDSLKLIARYNAKSRDMVVGILKKNTHVHVRAEGMIEISYSDKNRELAAEIANALTRELDHINRLTKVRKASELRRFIENELQKNNLNLKQAEIAMQNFQRENKAISLDDQTTASISAAANLYSQMTIDQINLKVLERSYSPDHPEVIALRYKISEIERRLRQLQEGSSLQGDSSIAFLSVPFSDLPELSLRYLQLLRDLKREETLHEVLNTQLEQAKITEAKDTPTISVLDWAAVPRTKYKPIRSFILLTAFLLSLVFSALLAVIYDRWQDFKNVQPERYQDVAGLLNILKKDLLGMKKKS